VVADLPVTGTQPNSKYFNASEDKNGRVPPGTVAGTHGGTTMACGSQPAVVPQVKRAPGSEMDSPHIKYKGSLAHFGCISTTKMLGCGED